MKKVLGGVGHIILIAFTVAIIVFMAIMNFKTLGRIFQDDLVQQGWGLVLFTGGTLSWFAIFLWASRGKQRPIALVMFGLSLVAEVIYSAADVLMGGQSWIAVDAKVGEFVIYTFIAMTFAHGAMLYIHFLSRPEVGAQIDLENLEDDVKEKAQARATELINQHIESMADTLAARAANSVYVGLRLPVPQVIDAVAQDVNDLRPAQAATDGAEKAGWFDKLFHRDGKPLAGSDLSDADIERLARAWTDLQLAHPTAPPPITAVPRATYTLEKLLDAIGRDADDTRAQLKNFELDQDADKAFDALNTYGVLPNDLSRENYQALHRELFSPAPETVNTVDAQFRDQTTQKPA